MTAGPAVRRARADPAAIERKLRVTALGRAGEEDLDADDLAQQCRRLVLLGGPGVG